MAYIIMTDNSCDTAPALLQSWNVSCIPLTYRFEKEENTGLEAIDANAALSVPDFYERMRRGAVAKTSAASPAVCLQYMEEILASGNDVIYLAFSSGLSSTYQSACIAARELTEKYPSCRIAVIDTLCASTGLGLLVYLAVQKKQEGASFDEVVDYIETTKPHLCHWFTVDTLTYLSRGGRVSPTAAAFGNILGIKPILHCDREGHLTPVSRVRGRRNSIAALAEAYQTLHIDTTVFISHGDCLADAELVKSQLTAIGARVILTSDIGPVIGAHSGPGTLAVFFLGKDR